ncbi:hypothetical protein EDB89DRAFT_1910956 [Lactarius sanguifluus]|nr:hypothetical protein EDB89DRAFT_1910956 [Lactarius sanguifluus]
MLASGAASTSQIVTLPHIPELFDPDFLDALLPPRSTPDATDVDALEPENTFMNALKSVAHRKYTQNSAPAFNSTLSHTLDAFQTLSLHMPREKINAVLSKAWEEDPSFALRIIWNTRSIHDGKGDKELFYKAFGWLYEHHPRTAIANLSQLVAPVCVVKSRSRSTQMPHGYWKDLLNILALATLEQLDTYPAPFLHVARGFFARGQSVGPKRLSTKERLAGMTAKQVGELLAARNQKARAIARERRVKNAANSHQLLLSKLSERRFRALYVAVARLFSDELVEQASLMRKVEALAEGEERDCILRKVSFVGKWAPTPSASHDRVTNISTAVAILLYRGGVMLSLSRPVDASAAVSGDDVHVLRSFYQRWVLTPLRASFPRPGAPMAARRWGDVSYNMFRPNNFFKHDDQRFDALPGERGEGKVQISERRSLPHELVAKAIAPTVHYQMRPWFRARVARREAQVADAQWNAMLARLREAGTLDNSLAVCDVSGSMGEIYWQGPRDAAHPLPPWRSRWCVAQLAKPPFANPEVVTLQEGVGVAANVAAMVRSSWGANTNLHAVFVRLLLPLAVQHRVPREDMVRRLFVFSDMQFDAAELAKGGEPGAWVTNHDAIARAYEEAGYDVPEIVYWNLAGELQTAPVEAERKGVALMSGFSPAMMKVFMGEDVEEPLDDDTVLVDEKGEEVKLPRKPEMTPLSIMKRALEKPSYDGLIVSD